jgi:formyltetrahydrofolate deformylase
LIQCPDQKGLIARISGLVSRCDGNILSADQHATSDEGGLFFLRLEFLFDPRTSPKQRLLGEFGALASELQARWHLRTSGERLRCAVLASSKLHCLSDLLYRHAAGELDMDISVILSNHDDGRRWAELYGIPFVVVPSRPQDRAQAEALILKTVQDTDFLVLARYMQILSPAFLAAYGKDIINIHHSFLPSFKGSAPYQQAYDRGVKIIGATAHFVTGDLDEGPIIEQVVQRVSHRDDVEALKRKGGDLERMALAQALTAYTHHRVMRHDNKTIVFE